MQPLESLPDFVIRMAPLTMNLVNQTVKAVFIDLYFDVNFIEIMLDSFVNKIRSFYDINSCLCQAYAGLHKASNESQFARPALSRQAQWLHKVTTSACSCIKLQSLP